MEEVTEKKQRKGCSSAFIVVVSLVVLFMASTVGASFVIEVPLYLAFGWVFFLKDNLMRINFGWEMIASSALGLIFCVWLTHAFCRWVARQKNREPWRLVQTLRLNALVLLFFAASCALVGFVHQSIWLFTNPVVVDRSRNLDRSRNYSNMSQIYLLLMEYEEEHGVFPDSLQVLQDQGYADEGEVFYARMGKMREPYWYLGKGRSTSDPGQTVILVSPFSHNGRVAYLRVDGSKREKMLSDDKRGEEQFQDLICDGMWAEDRIK